MANLCRPTYPGTHLAGSSDPFQAAQRVPVDQRTPPPAGAAGPIGPEVFGCVHADGEVRGLIAMGGDRPCLAAIGDVRSGPDPDGPAVTCPPWLHANEVALFHLGLTMQARDDGVADACCYRFRHYVYIDR